MDKKKVIVTFRGPEVEALSRVTQALGEPSEQDALRTLVKREDDERARRASTYGPKAPAVPRETKAERMRRLLSLPDHALTATLRPILDEEFKKEADDTVEIFTNAVTGARMIRFKSPSTGMHDEMALEYYLRQWESAKRLESLSTPPPGV